FYKIYNEFLKPCTAYRNDNKASCYKEESLGKIEASLDVTNLLKDLYSHLYRIYETVEMYTNDYFEHVRLNNEKLGCLCLKHWLYDQITMNVLKEPQINELFQGWEAYIKEKTKYHNLKRCVFYNLNENEINRIKKIYVLNTILYSNSNNSEAFVSDQGEYMDYFWRSCSRKVPMDNYCKEFDEFVNICKDESLDSGISIYDENTKSTADGAKKYLLYSQKYKEQLLYVYIKNENLLNFVKTSDFLSNKSTTIAVTSVVGSAIGLSSIFYYFYKFTPFGSTLRKGQRKNIVNIDGEAHNELSYTSDIKQSSFKNREYKVAYHSYNNS
ncbi:variable surface protein Vir21, truncated, putative, partial [Plasmodium vivax]